MHCTIAGGGGESEHAPCRAARRHSLKEEDTVPPMPSSSFVIKEGAVPPIPPDAFVKVEVGRRQGGGGFC